MRDRGWLAAGAGVAALVALFPIGDPDLWWHLSAARFIVERAALPRADWLSYTLAGKAWADFEWLSEILFYAAYRAGGLAALWALKAAIFSVAAALLWALLKRSGLGPPACAAGAAAWAVCLIPRSEIRVELFSNIAFAALLIAVGWVRAGPFGKGDERFPRRVLLGFAGGFALWANLHAGFAAGLLLLGLHAAGDLLEPEPQAKKRAAFFLAAALAGLAGAVLNPYGFGIYSILWAHAADSSKIAGLIQEWGGLRPGRSVHWPAFLLLLATGAAFIRSRRKGPLQAGPWLAAAAFGLLCLRHARMVPYFATAAVPLALGLLEGLKPETARRACAALALACGLFAADHAVGAGLLRGVWQDRFVPREAADFLEKHPALLERRMCHAWAWGGYLGFRFSPKLKVFQDGRYIFHGLFAEAAEAAREPGTWQGFLAKYGVEAAVVENLPFRVKMPRIYPDGTTRDFMRPYYAAFFPKDSWALLHFDEKALVFAKRAAFAKSFLEPLEYRLLRPGDEEALDDALRRGEADVKRLDMERKRHGKE